MCSPISAAWAWVDGLRDRFYDLGCHWYLPYEQAGRALDVRACIKLYFLDVVAFESCKGEGHGGPHG